MMEDVVLKAGEKLERAKKLLKKIDKIVGGSGRIRLDDDDIAEIKSLDYSELGELEMEVQRRILEKRGEFIQLTRRMKRRRLASKKLKRYSSKSNKGAGLN